MSKNKETQVPLPGLQSRSKRKPPPTPGKSALSQEFVDDSDDSSDEAIIAQTTSKSVQIGVHPPRAHGPGKFAAGSSIGTKASKSRDRQIGAPAKVPAGNVVPKHVTAEAQTVESTSSSEESEDEGTNTKAAQQRKAAGREDTSNEDSASSAESSSEESAEEAAPKPSAQQLASRPKSVHPQLQTVEFQAARPYIPPRDFIAAPTTRASTSAPTNALHNLQGKQVWHITAPAGLSLKDLKHLAMAQAMRGGAIISRDGTEYGLLASGNEDAAEEEVLIPGQNGYKTVSARIIQSFNIREIVNLPKLSSKQSDPNTGSEAAASITRSTIRAPRPQVKGLKMRYFPSGIADCTPTTFGLSDSEDEAPAAEPAGLGIPKGVHAAYQPEKRKHADANGYDGVENPAKKHKKHQTAEEAQKKADKKARKEAKKKQRHEGHARSKS